MYCAASDHSCGHYAAFAVKNEINKIGVNINQIAKIANTGRDVNYNMVLVLKQYIDEMRAIINKAFIKGADYGVHKDSTDKDGNTS